MTPEERFWDKVDKTGACWTWMGATDGRTKEGGYGQIWLDRRNEKAHRFSWMLHHGPIPGGSCVLHHCDNSLCVRPNHLFLGSQSDNLKDMAAKGRGTNQYATKTHCPQGHPYDGRNTRIVQGKRYCRACGAERARRKRHRTREEPTT